MAIQVAQPPLYTASETKSTNILGPTYFELCDLRVAGTAGQPALPMQIAPAQSPYIVASNEQFSVSVDIKYNNTPLTRLLLCLGLEMEVHFAFEGIGGKAAETDVAVTEVTQKDEFTYTVTWTGTPDALKLTKGLYGIAAIVSISPADHPCSQEVIGYGYVAARLMQVFPA